MTSSTLTGLSMEMQCFAGASIMKLATLLNILEVGLEEEVQYSL